MLSLSIFAGISVSWQGSLLSKLWISARSNRSKVFWGKVVLKICSKFTGEHLCRSVISMAASLSAKTLFFASKINEKFRSLPLMKYFFFYILGWYLILFNTFKNKISNVWPCYIARVLPITMFSTSLLKFS